MLLVIFTETKRRGVVPRGHLCWGWSGGRWVGPHRGTGEPEAGVQVVPSRWCPPALTSVGTFCWVPGEGSSRQSGAWEGLRLYLWKALPRGSAGRDRRPRPASCWAGQPEASSSFWSLGSVSPRLEGRRRCQDSPEPREEGASGAPGSVFGRPSGSLGAGRDVNTGGARKGKAVLGCARA